MYQEHGGELSFATDTWTSSNHTAFVAVTVHLIYNEKPLAMVLDVVELAMMHYSQTARNILYQNIVNIRPTVV